MGQAVENSLKSLLAVSLLLASATTSHSAPPLRAFPMAQGFGAMATGGRGGAVYHVTNLNDSGPGSLRYGIQTASTPTTIVFEVGGNIELKSELVINNSGLTIAGQTAPGDGIAVISHSTHIAGASDVIVRYLRFRAGDSNANNGAQDSLSVSESQRVVIDHVSASWGLDESLSVTRSNFVTVQYCIIAETLNRKHHAYGSLVRGNVDVNNPGGYSFHHNLWIHNDRRNPGIGSYQQTDKRSDLELDLSNNVVYNWGARSLHTVESRDAMRLNLRNNTFIAGPSSRDAVEVMRAEVLTRNVNLHEAGNLIDDDKNKQPNPHAVTRSMFHPDFLAEINFVPKPFVFPGLSRLQTAQESYGEVLATAGASLHRDAVDTRLINDVKNRTGRIINSQIETGGFPLLQGGAAPLDTDRDSMPDAWEREHGLTANDPADRNGMAMSGYTNLENYLESLLKDR